MFICQRHLVQIVQYIYEQFANSTSCNVAAAKDRAGVVTCDCDIHCCSDDCNDKMRERRVVMVIGDAAAIVPASKAAGAAPRPCTPPPDPVTFSCKLQKHRPPHTSPTAAASTWAITCHVRARRVMWRARSPAAVERPAHIVTCDVWNSKHS